MVLKEENQLHKKKNSSKHSKIWVQSCQSLHMYQILLPIAQSIDFDMFLYKSSFEWIYKSMSQKDW